MDSNNTNLKFISPTKRKHSIPTLFVVDMDKIISPDQNHKDIDEQVKYSLYKDSAINPIYNDYIAKKEEFAFYSKTKKYNKKKDTLDKRNSIIGALKNNKFTIKNPGYYMVEKEFTDIILKIQNYCLRYNTFSFSTTIEGALINTRNCIDVIRWMIEKRVVDKEKLGKIVNRKDEADISFITTVLRLICNGKYNSLHKLDKLEIDLKTELKELNNEVGKKTGGWIDEWLEFYFKNNIDNLDSLDKKRSKFKNDFYELYFILNKIENLI